MWVAIVFLVSQMTKVMMAESFPKKKCNSVPIFMLACLILVAIEFYISVSLINS